MWDTVLKKLEELLLFIPRKLFQWYMENLAEILQGIEAPEWYSYATNIFNGSSDFAYWLDVFNVPAGMGIIFSAYLTRFLIRRIPVIG